ncbi:MAG: Xaa-Pro peptidase family protein [Actinomycetes bacterium]
MSVAARQGRVNSLLAGLDVQALLVTNPVNCRYLSGFAASNAAFVAADCALYVTDSRYATAVAEQCPELEVVLDRDAAAGAVHAAARMGVSRLGFESHVVTVADALRLEALGRSVGVSLIACESVIEPLRETKDDDEIAHLTVACAVTERALARLIAEVHVGLTERWLAARLEFLMCDEGAEAAAFPSIVATGDSSAEPHHQPTDRVVGAGDLLKIDCGARVAGYHADMTRTFVVGRPAQAWQSEIHELVGRAAAAGRAAVAPGVALVDLDRASRDVIASAGHALHFGHGLGHGIGLDIHEAPMIGPSATGTLAENMTVTVEPGIYLPGLGGVRIEDSLVVTSNGATPLTSTTRELLVLG